MVQDFAMVILHGEPGDSWYGQKEGRASREKPHLMKTSAEDTGEAIGEGNSAEDTGKATGEGNSAECIGKATGGEEISVCVVCCSS